MFTLTSFTGRRRRSAQTSSASRRAEGRILLLSPENTDVAVTLATVVRGVTFARVLQKSSSLAVEFRRAAQDDFRTQPLGTCCPVLVKTQRGAVVCVVREGRRGGRAPGAPTCCQDRPVTRPQTPSARHPPPVSARTKPQEQSRACAVVLHSGGRALPSCGCTCGTVEGLAVAVRGRRV